MGEPGEEIAQLQRPDKPMRPHKHTSALGVLRLVPNSFASQDVAVARRPTVYVKLRIHRTVRLPGSECAMAGKVWPRSHVVPDRTAQSSSKRVGRESEAEPNHGLFVCTAKNMAKCPVCRAMMSHKMEEAGASADRCREEQGRGEESSAVQCSAVQGRMRQR
ncbi:hypothetical protein AXG93_4804s1020 [Marchantia polymorpha subsp. ruderalis]|uniref:Uncharacterized protein n=1 Tax=Marchantia polymorpha subsp. ruderalis TaxID=1480154 RepID=A0A176VN14_MARPO|nr:hypothetical protein AXG93_4804s1020 [Marchantia polymorpha subsp. ruderalis]